MHWSLLLALYSWCYGNVIYGSTVSPGDTPNAPFYSPIASCYTTASSPASPAFLLLCHTWLQWLQRQLKEHPFHRKHSHPTSSQTVSRHREGTLKLPPFLFLKCNHNSIYSEWFSSNSGGGFSPPAITQAPPAPPQAVGPGASQQQQAQQQPQQFHNAAVPAPATSVIANPFLVHSW